MIYEPVIENVGVADMWFVKEKWFMYVCHVQMSHVNTGELPGACSLYSLGQAGVVHGIGLFSSHPGPSLLSYLICTSLSSPSAPCSTAFSKDIMVFSGPSCVRKGHQAFNLTVFSANIPCRVGRGPSNEKTLGSRVWFPWLFLQRICLHSTLLNLIWELGSSEAMSLGTIKRIR